MKNLFENWDYLEMILRRKPVFLFLDYDGTLTPIVDRPEMTVLSDKTKKILETLVKIPSCRVVIVSGRSLQDVSQLVGIKEAVYVGNHGFEIQGPKVNFENPSFPECREIFLRIIEQLREKLKDIKGVIIEDKGLTLSVHYRTVTGPDAVLLAKEFVDVIYPYQASGRIRVRQGKRVYELRPPLDWDKGKAVLWLLNSFQEDMRSPDAAALYIGDDETDEDAFESLKDGGITVRVGNADCSAAQYYVAGTAGVNELLSRIVSLKRIPRWPY